MKSKTFTSVRAEEHVISEANGRASREQIILAAPAADLPAGTVLGVVTASGKYAAFNQDAVDGTGDAVAILAPNVDALETPADTRSVAHVRNCEVNGQKLAWPSDIEPAEKATAEAALGDLGIIVRY